MENTELITKAIEYARKNFNDTNMSVHSVADYAGFSIDYFNRIFLSYTGFTVMAYVNYMRIKKAIELLRNTDNTVLDIALEVGYDSHEGFIKAFKKIYKITPNEYRKLNRSKVLSWNELTDSSCIKRFLHENTEFKYVDSAYVIDYLLEKDGKRYGYFCTTIKSMGLEIVALSGNIENGFIGIGDDRNGGMWLELVSDDFQLLADWIKRFNNATNFYSAENPEIVREKLKFYGINYEIEAVYLTGDFGVYSATPFETLERRGLRTEGPFTLAAAKDIVKDGAIAPQGYPFFAGKMTFKKSVHLTAQEAKKALFTISRLSSNVTEVRVNGQDAGRILWHPYTLDIAHLCQEGVNTIEVTVTGNLRNLLGPFHLKEGECFKVGPHSFFHESSVWVHGINPNWVNTYCFVEYGLFFE